MNCTGVAELRNTTRDHFFPCSIFFCSFLLAVFFANFIFWGPDFWPEIRASFSQKCEQISFWSKNGPVFQEVRTILVLVKKMALVCPEVCTILVFGQTMALVWLEVCTNLVLVKRMALFGRPLAAMKGSSPILAGPSQLQKGQPNVFLSLLCGGYLFPKKCHPNNR